MKKKKVLFVIATQHTGRFFELWYKRFKFIKLFKDTHDFYFCSFLQNKGKFLYNFGGDIFRYKEIIDFSDYHNCQSWKKSFDMLRYKFSKYKFNEIFIGAFPINLRYENDGLIVNKYEQTFEDDKFCMKFIQAWKSFKYYLLAYFYMKEYGINVRHFIIDPLELNLPGSNRYFFYKNDNIKANYFPFIEYTEFFDLDFDDHYVYSDIKKDFDFVCGYTNTSATERYRGSSTRTMMKLAHLYKKFKIFLLDHKRGIDTLISNAEYNFLIKRAKYTFMFPSYDRNEFSMIRFYEAINRDCIPLIHVDNNLSIAFRDKIELFDIIVNDLIIENISDIPKKIKKLDHKKIIKKIKNTPEIKILYSRKFYNSMAVKHDMF
jgi:hypothetical protein